MSMAEKVCPIVVRTSDRRLEVLAFVHPLAGRQFVKGTIERGETPIKAAKRELREESGLKLSSPLIALGEHKIGVDNQVWHFFECHTAGLPETWRHATEDDFGHSFVFFWHSVAVSLNQEWHPIFHEAFAFFAPRLSLS